MNEKDPLILFEAKNVNGEAIIEGSQNYTKEEAKGSFLGSIFNIMTCAVGSGVLSLPFAFRETGLAFGMIILTSMAVINVYSLDILVLCGHIARKTNYQDTAQHVFGNVGSFIVKLMLFIGLFGSMVAFCIIIGDLLNPVICEWSGHRLDCEIDVFYLNRNFICGMVVVFIVVPLAFFTKMHQLESTSVIAVLSVIILLVVVTWRSIENMASSGRNYEPPELFRFSIFGLANAIPIMAFALGCHAQIIPIYTGMEPKWGNIPRFRIVFILANIFCMLLYHEVGIFGLLDFKGDTKDNILLNYKPSDILAMIGRLSMVLHVTLAFPILVWPCRSVLDSFMFETNDQRYSRLRNVLETLGLLGFAFLLGVFVPKLNLVFGFTGSVCSMCINYILPSAMYLKIGPKSLSKRIPAILLVFFGFVVGVASTAILSYQLVKTTKV